MNSISHMVAAHQEENKVEALTRIDDLIQQLHAVRIITACYWPANVTHKETA